MNFYRLRKFYDALSRLVRQTDARGQRICLYYDKLDRLTWKHYRTDDACPTSHTGTVHYTYDQGTNQYGYRTRMDDPSGFTTWAYDARGRLSQETKSITGSGTFVTGWGYNSADLVSSMTYPTDPDSGIGETVYTSYHPQMLANAVSGTSTYVQSTTYDAAGRTDVRTLGANVLKTDYDYYPWKTTPAGPAQGRLKQIKTGTQAVKEGDSASIRQYPSFYMASQEGA